MTAAFVWNELKKVVIIDHEINQLRKAAQKEQEHVASALAAHQKKMAALSEAEQTVRTFQKEIDRGELSIKECRGQIQRRSNQLASLMSNKERIALEHEINTLKADIDGRENTLMNLLEQQEIVKATLTKLKDEVARSAQTTESIKNCSETKCKECQSRIATLEQESTALLPLVPEALRTEYVQLKTRIANPAAPVISNNCSACFMSLLSQEAASLNTRLIIRCRNCYRFLYLPDATTETMTGK